MARSRAEGDASFLVRPSRGAAPAGGAAPCCAAEQLLGRSTRDDGRPCVPHPSAAPSEKDQSSKPDQRQDAAGDDVHVTPVHVARVAAGARRRAWLRPARVARIRRAQILVAACPGGKRRISCAGRAQVPVSLHLPLRRRACRASADPGRPAPCWEPATRLRVPLPTSIMVFLTRLIPAPFVPETPCCDSQLQHLPNPSHRRHARG